MDGPPEDHDGTEDLGRRVLEEHPHFQLVLLDGQRWSCQLLAWGRYELLVETPEGRCLVPQHAIAYIILDGDTDAPSRAATATVLAMPELAEAAESPGGAVAVASEEQPDPPIP